MASGCATSSDALALEASLATCPDDLFIRVTLIRYYHRNRVDGRSRMHPHVLWLLEHHPEIDLHEALLDPVMDGDAYERACDLRIAAIAANPGNLAVLDNALWLVFFGAPDRSESLLREAATLAADDLEWRWKLGGHWVLRWKTARMPAERQRLAAEAAAELERVRASAEATLAYLAGIDLALIALELGDHARAAKRARALLAGAEAHAATWYHGNAIHYANIALGHVALAANALESAKLHLAAAGATCGSPQLDSFGPDFELAQAILATGEHDAVVAYLEACKRFWRLDHGKLAQWSAAVSRGELPRMGHGSPQ